MIKNIRRVDLKKPQINRKPVLTRSGALIPKWLKEELNKMEKRLWDNYATIEKMDTGDEYRLTRLLRDHLERMSMHMGPREEIREKLGKIKEDYPLTVKTMLVLLDNIKTEKEVIDRVKSMVKANPELHEKLVSENVPIDEKVFLIKEVIKRLEETHGPVLVKEVDSALKGLRIKDIRLVPTNEEDPKLNDFWQIRKEELKHNPYIQAIKQVEEEYPDKGGRVKDEVEYAINILKSYKSGEISDEELEDGLNDLVDIGMEILGGDREEFLGYLKKFDTTENKELYNMVSDVLRAGELRTNRDVEKKVELVLRKHIGDKDIQELRKTPAKKIRRIIGELVGEGIHPEELRRVIKKTVGKKGLAEIDKKLDEALTYSNPPEGMYM